MSDEAVSRIVAALREVPAFAYGQGSGFMGFTADSDLDVVVVWDGDDIPAEPRIDLVGRLDDAGHEAVRFFRLETGVDKLRVGRRDVDLFHCSAQTFGSWCEQVLAGDGWQRSVWPLPLYAVAGFVNATQLTDPRGSAAQARDRLATFPSRLHANALTQLREEWHGYDVELMRCVEREDGWLFHELARKLLRTVYVTWFAARGRYCPLPKHLRQWVERFDLDQDVAELDRQLWTAPTLVSKLAIVRAIVDRVASF